MPDLWMDVDAALSEVPVNILALLDDTTFKDREVGIVYNQAGMDLEWNFVTTAGATSQTAVTPTTSGLHDWAHQGGGLYTLEIPASGGTINNDTEGFGWFTGFATGVLPWRGPIIGFRASGLNDLLIDSAYSATRGLAGTALPAAAADAAGGLPISDAGGLDLDTQIGTDIDAILVDTAVIGALGAGLTAVPWNSSWDAEVQSEAADALTGYDPPTKAEMDTAHALLATSAGLATHDGKLDTVDTVVDAILVDTAVIGALGAGLTAVPWNAAWDAEVQSEVDDALVANNLDHLAKTATAAADMTTEVVDNSILSRILANGDTSAFDPSTDGLQPIRDTAPLGTAMRGTDSAATATALTTHDGKLDTVDTVVDAILADTGADGVVLPQAQADKVWGTAARALTDKAGFGLAADQSTVTVGTVSTLTGHTAQTGDSFAQIGTAGASLTDLGGMSTGMKAEVESEVDDALVANNLDHLAKTATAAADMTTEVADNTILSRILANGDTSGFVPSTDGLQLIRDKQTDIETDTAVIGALGAGLTAVPWNSTWDAEVQSEAADALTAYDPPTDTEMDTAFAALNDISTAEVNAEVVDALNVDTYAEPGQGAPAATATLAAKLGYLYKAFRNKLTQSATELKIYDDAGSTVGQKATISDDGTIYTRGEIGSGA